MAQVIKYKNFDIRSISFSELNDNKKALKRKAYLNYNNGGFNLQTNNLKLDNGGIPRISEWVKSEKDRQYCYVPLDACTDLEKTRETKDEHSKRVKETNTLKKVFQEIDDKVGSKEFQKQLFGAETEKYTHKYYTIIKRKTYDDDSDDEEKERPVVPDKFKVKFYAFDYSTGDYEGPNCDLYTKKSGEKGNGTKIDTKGMSIDDFSKYVGYMRNMTFILQFGFWADKKKSRSDPINYGITLTIKLVQVEERKQLSTQSLDYSISLLSSDDEDEDEDEDEEDEKEDEKEDEEDDLEEVKPKRRSRSKKSTV